MKYSSRYNTKFLTTIAIVPLGTIYDVVPKVYVEDATIRLVVLWSGLGDESDRRIRFGDAQCYWNRKLWTVGRRGPLQLASIAAIF